jgi:hypothetical protein
MRVDSDRGDGVVTQHMALARTIIWADFALAAGVILIVFFVLWVKRQSRRHTREAERQAAQGNEDSQAK